MIEVFPRRPPLPTEQNAHSSAGRLQDKQRSIVVLQLRHDPELPYIRASHVAGSAWVKGSPEYRSQSESIRGGIVRCHLSGRPDNVDANKQLLKTKSGKDQNEAWTVESFQGTLTMQAHAEASAIINEVCDRYEEHLAAGRKNVHFYYLDDQDAILECDLDREPAPELPASHKLVSESTFLAPEALGLETAVNAVVCQEPRNTLLTLENESMLPCTQRDPIEPENPRKPLLSKTENPKKDPTLDSSLLLNRSGNQYLHFLAFSILMFCLGAWFLKKSDPREYQTSRPFQEEKSVLMKGDRTREPGTSEEMRDYLVITSSAPIFFDDENK